MAEARKYQEHRKIFKHGEDNTNSNKFYPIFKISSILVKIKKARKAGDDHTHASTVVPWREKMSRVWSFRTAINGGLISSMSVR